jgi:hypothetical protein
MMIPFLTDYYREGYLEQPTARSLTAYFPNCNLAIRKQVA